MDRRYCFNLKTAVLWETRLASFAGPITVWQKTSPISGVTVKSSGHREAREGKGINAETSYLSSWFLLIYSATGSHYVAWTGLTLLNDPPALASHGPGSRGVFCPLCQPADSAFGCFLSVLNLSFCKNSDRYCMHFVNRVNSGRWRFNQRTF